MAHPDDHDELWGEKTARLTFRWTVLGALLFLIAALWFTH